LPSADFHNSIKKVPVSSTGGVWQIQDRSRQNASVIGCATQPVLIVATGLGFATRPGCTIVEAMKRNYSKDFVWMSEILFSVTTRWVADN